MQPLVLATAASAAGGLVNNSPVCQLVPNHCTSAPDPKYTSSLLNDLWSGISVQTAAVTAKVNGVPLPTGEVAPPPNLPEFESSYRLPHDFVWGWAGAAYQLEGAVDADGKGPSVWDTISHKYDLIKDGRNGDIADNHYYLYEQDAQRLAALGVKSYSLTISWPRIFPFGNGTVNEAGLLHYRNEIEYLVKVGVEPIVTLFHWDTPTALQNWYGGWLGREIVDDFAEYARVVFEAYGDLVKLWFTINEPQSFCTQYQTFGELASDKDFPLVGHTPLEAVYKCGHNALIAHAKAVDIFRKEIIPKYGNDRRISYKHAWPFTKPWDDKSKEDQAASDRSLDYRAGWFSQPVHGDGDYPKTMKDTLRDILPEFTPEEMLLVQGSADFYNWDGYTGNYIASPPGGIDACANDSTHELWPICVEPRFLDINGWPIGQHGDTGVPWLYTTADFFRGGVKWAWNKYNLKEIMIGEFGFSVFNESSMDVHEAIYDTPRVDYYDQYLHSILTLVNVDKINVTGAFGWSLMDNLEWAAGYGPRFGLQHVDYDTFKRTFKKSAHYFVAFFQHYVL